MKAWELLSDKSKWTRGYNARDKDGRVVSITNPEATCWCTVGAIFKVYDDFNMEMGYREKYGSYWDKIYDRIKDIPNLIVEPRYPDTKIGLIITWNDDSERTYEEVHSLLKELDI